MTGVPTLVARILVVIERIRTAIQQVPLDKDNVAHMYFGWAWLGRVGRDLDRLVARVEAGLLKPLLPSRRRPQPRKFHFTDHAMFRRRGWLRWQLKESQPFAQDLELLISNPELQPLYMREPVRFGRLIRPLCRAMHLVPPEALRPQPRPGPDSAAAAAQPTPAAPTGRGAEAGPAKHGGAPAPPCPTPPRPAPACPAPPPPVLGNKDDLSLISARLPRSSAARAQFLASTALAFGRISKPA